MLTFSVCAFCSWTYLPIFANKRCVVRPSSYSGGNARSSATTTAQKCSVQGGVEHQLWVLPLHATSAGMSRAITIQQGITGKNTVGFVAGREATRRLQCIPHDIPAFDIPGDGLVGSTCTLLRHGAPVWKFSAQLVDIFREALDHFNTVQDDLVNRDILAFYIVSCAERYSGRAYAKCMAFENVVEFIDGTVIWIERPKERDNNQITV